MQRDIVCGMMVDTAIGLYADYLGKKYYFCIESCMEEFLVDPEKYINEVKNEQGEYHKVS